MIEATSRRIFGRKLPHSTTEDGRRMNRFLRRGMLGAMAGGVAGFPFLLTAATSGYDFFVGVIAGAIYAAGVCPARNAYADNMMTAASLGIPLWGITSLIVVPLFSGGHMIWNAEEMREHFPALIEWVSFGCLFGIELQLLSDFAWLRFGPESNPLPPPPHSLRRIVILGGGFALYSNARRGGRKQPGTQPYQRPAAQQPPLDQLRSRMRHRDRFRTEKSAS